MNGAGLSLRLTCELRSQGIVCGVREREREQGVGAAASDFGGYFGMMTSRVKFGSDSSRWVT